MGVDGVRRRLMLTAGGCLVSQNMLMLVIVGGLCSASAVGLFFYHRGMLNRLRAKFADDPDVRVSDGLTKQLVTLPPHLGARIVEADGGESHPALWVVNTDPSRFAGRSTLHLSLETFSSRLAKMVGHQDIQIGDPKFDNRFQLFGSDPDALRGIFSDPDVQRSLYSFFKESEIQSLDVDEYGRVTCRALRRSGGGDEMKDVLLAVVHFTHVLGLHSDKPAIGAPESA